MEQPNLEYINRNHIFARFKKELINKILCIIMV